MKNGTPKEILNAAILYTTNRLEFLKKYSGTLHEGYLNLLFLGAATRPDLAEEIAVILYGYSPIPKKHGFDGINENKTPKYAEVKVRTTDSERISKNCNKKGNSSNIGSITVNDPSQNIIDKYNKHSPVFLFPFYIDGHLICIFSQEWARLKPHYEKTIKNAKEKTEQGNPPARLSVSLTIPKWLPHSKLVFLNENEKSLWNKLPIKMEKYIKNEYNKIKGQNLYE